MPQVPSTKVPTAASKPLHAQQPVQVIKQDVQQPVPQSSTAGPAVQPAKSKRTKSRNHRFEMRITPKEKSIISSLRQQWNLGSDAAVIQKLLDEHKSNCGPVHGDNSELIKEISNLNRQLSGVSNNMNQIARRANSDGVDMNLIDESKKCVSAIYGYAKQITDALGKHLRGDD